MESQTHRGRKFLYTLISLGALGGLGYLGYQNYQLTGERTALEIDLANTKQDFASKTASLMANIEAIKQLLITTQSDKVTAEQDIQKQQAVLDAMSGTLGLYQKLVNTDKELLEKYSKVFFLSENYIPKSLIKLPVSYTEQPENDKYISTQVWPFLQRMLDDAQATSTDLKIISAYRSFDTQTTLKSAYKVTFGTGSNKFSADQGYSEHQLGTTIDFTTIKLGLDNTLFAKTAGYTWLTENAYKYGFVLSYPKGNAYYIFEPWHWRFVGKKLAQRLHDSKINFVDMPQRDIDEYLITLFD